MLLCLSQACVGSYGDTAACILNLSSRWR